MDRVLRGSATTISVTFYVDGTATNPSPDSATLKVTSAEGTILVAAGTSATDAGTGKFTFTLTPTHTANLDLLTVDWTATISGQVQTVTTYVEIVGAFYFTVADARALYPLGDTTKYPTADIVKARNAAEEMLERACGRAFVPRYGMQTFSGTGETSAMLGRIPVRVLRSVSVDGSVYAGDNFTNVLVTGLGTIYNPLGFTRGNANVVVGYEYGDLYPPEEGRRAALLLAKDRLVQSLHDPRAESITTEAGTVRFGTGTFGIPEVDSFVDAYRLPAIA